MPIKVVESEKGLGSCIGADVDRGRHVSVVGAGYSQFTKYSAKYGSIKTLFQSE